MRFMIGYQMLPDDALLDLVLERREAVSEVYFAWPGFASRPGVLRQRGLLVDE